MSNPLKLWRCQNESCTEDPHGRLIYDFAAEHPVCPKCGADGRTVAGSNAVVKREVIHYLVIDPAGSLATPHGRRSVACQPAASRVPSHTTGQWEAVTCLDCQESEPYCRDRDAGAVQDARIVRGPALRPEDVSRG